MKKSSNEKYHTLYLSCPTENHTNGGVHYHLAFKLSSPKNKHEIVIHFSEHENHYSTFRDISKYYTNINLSSQHPNLKK